MNLVLNEDQSMLKEAAESYCRENVSLGVLRRLRDTHDEKGYDQAIWKQIVELGWTGMTVPEQFGGFGFGYTGLGIVLQASGRSLLNSPLISTVLLSGTAINLGGSESQKSRLLPAMVAGHMLMALAIDETAHHDPVRVATTSSRDGEDFVINGGKVSVLDGHVAEWFVVSARGSGELDESAGISLFLVAADAPGVTVRRTNMVDGRNCANVSFDNVRVTREGLVGPEGDGFQLLERVLDVGCIGLAAEMLGSVEEVFDRIVEYLKQREQFGVPIGAFQGLQHRAADMYCEIELCRSVVLAALEALDNEPEKAPALASLAKAKLCETFFTVSNEGVQMHGGIGMTDEFDIGFFLKRARVAQQTLGDANFHRDRFARLSGF